MSPERPLRVALTALGCKVNFAEMAELAGRLAAGGCDVVPEAEHADVRVLNSCTVTLQADATTRQRLRRLRALDPAARLVLTGCSVDTNPDVFMPAGPTGERRPAHGLDAVFPNIRKAEVADYILSMTGPASPRDSPTSALRARAFLKVQDGCDHRCTYCIVWRARGASVSVSPDAVLEQARQAVDRGQHELVISGVDLGSYGRDGGTSLASLLTRLLNEIGDHARIRLSSVNANDVTSELIALNAHPRLCSHWHLPLQSGSDTVLRAMHRGYRRAQYLRVVEALRAQDPLTEFTSDVMVGFPGESDGDHQDTISLIGEVGFLSCHVFRWSPRPETPASALASRVDDATARRRSAEVRRAAARAGERSLRAAVGRIHEAVWDRVEGDIAHGITSTYHDVISVVPGGVSPGALALVRADAVDGGALRATVLAA